LYNVVFTALPIITFAILDEDIGRGNVLKNPQLYIDGQKNRLFKPFGFLMWIFSAIYQSLIIYFLIFYTYSNSNTFNNGENIGLYDFGLVIYICILITITLRIALESKRWVW
jgi:magnesium-transporting ATPase (P-type)